MEGEREAQEAEREALEALSALKLGPPAEDDEDEKETVVAEDEPLPQDEEPTTPRPLEAATTSDERESVEGLLTKLRSPDTFLHKYVHDYPSRESAAYHERACYAYSDLVRRHTRLRDRVTELRRQSGGQLHAEADAQFEEDVQEAGRLIELLVERDGKAVGSPLQLIGGDVRYRAVRDEGGGSGGEEGPGGEDDTPSEAELRAWDVALARVIPIL